MAAPSATARQDPTGIRMDDGYRTLITFSADPDVQLWEKSVKPPGLEGGEPIDTTTMHNDTLRTASPRALKTMTAGSIKCAYDPILFTSILALINVEQTITVTFPDTTTLAFYGFVKSFSPEDLQEGDQPMASVEFVPTNQDPTTGAEETFVLVNATGT